MESQMDKTASYFRTELYRLKIPIYKMAALIDVHPSRLSVILNGHVPLPDDVASKIQQAITNYVFPDKP